jgi:hypothetical protein
MTRIAIIAAMLCLGGLALTGCAQTATWSRDGVSPEVAAQDLADCRNDAQEANRRQANIDADIMASRGRDWQKTGVLDAQQQTRTADQVDRAANLVTSCMIGKGYAPRS